MHSARTRQWLPCCPPSFGIISSSRVRSSFHLSKLARRPYSLATAPWFKPQARCTIPSRDGDVHRRIRPSYLQPEATDETLESLRMLTPFVACKQPVAIG